MIFTHQGRAAIRQAVIGGRRYKVVLVGGRLWLAENLDYKFSGCTIAATGSPTTPAAWYYDNNEADYGVDGTYRCGLLYNWYAVDYLETNKATLCPGWHVATVAEWSALVSAAGSATVLKAVDNTVVAGWPSSWNGTDTARFGVLPCGRYNGSFGLLGTDGRYWAADSYSSSAAYDRRFTSGSSVGADTNQKTVGYSVRLVKD